MYPPSLASSNGSSTCSCSLYGDPMTASSIDNLGSPTKFRYGGRGGAGSFPRLPLGTSAVPSEGPSPPGSTCTICGRKPTILSRASTRAPSSRSQPTSDSPPKIRYGGRGGAGSRARSLPPKKQGKKKGLKAINAQAESKSQPSNDEAELLKRAGSELPDAPPTRAFPSTPPHVTSSLAGRRGASSILTPLILPPPSSQGMPTPPLSTTSSSATTSTAADNGPTRTPRTPYFYFDDHFDAARVPTESPLSSPTAAGVMSRSLRRMASRTQEFFSKERAADKAPPPPPLPLRQAAASTFDTAAGHWHTPHTPQSRVPVPPVPKSVLSPTSSCASSRTSVVTSEWYDPRASSASLAISPPAPESIVVGLPHSPHPSGRGRSASDVTVRDEEPPRPTKTEWTYCDSSTHGRWNRADIEQVIVGLRMLK